MLGAGVQIFVSENDLIKARQTINDKIEPDNTELICPHCGSNEIGLGIGKHKGLKIFNMLIAVFALIPIGNLKPKYYCNKCKNEIK